AGAVLRVSGWRAGSVPMAGKVAIRSPKASGAAGLDGMLGKFTGGKVKPGMVSPGGGVCPLELPYRSRFGSSKSRPSGKATVGLSRLALSTKGMGTLVTNRATATAAPRPRIRPIRMPVYVPPELLDFLRALAISAYGFTYVRVRTHPAGSDHCE